MAKIIKNRILEKNYQGKKGLGCTFVFPCVEAVEILGMLGGFDYISLDAEHGLFTTESIDAMCRTAEGHGMSVIVRVPNIESSTLNVVLDRGVVGITGPHIETVEQAHALAAGCRYTTDGTRSWGGGRGTFYNDSGLADQPQNHFTEYMALANKEMMVTAQLETTKAFENLDSILQVQGIDAVTWGPNDFAQSMGLPGQPTHPDVQEAHRKAAELVHAAGRKLQSDVLTGLNLPTVIIEAGRKFLEANQ